MNGEQIADNVKRFRELADSECISRGHGLNVLGLEMLETINALVRLVGEMRDALDDWRNDNPRNYTEICRDKIMKKADMALYKSSTIAVLKDIL